MKKSEREAQEKLRALGVHVTKKGGGHSADNIDHENLKHGLIARIVGNPPKREG